MAHIEEPGWKRALYMKDWDGANKIIIKNCQGAAKKMQTAWGSGGSQGTKKLENFDGWFENLTERILELHADKRLSKEAEAAALQACVDVLAVRKVPHWEHVNHIQTIREYLRQGKSYDDYPEGTIDEDDDEGM